MTKSKIFTLFLMVLALLLVIPNVSNAATEYTYSDTEQGIEWSYELDDSNNVINLKCKTTSKTGTVTIPSTIDGRTVISLKGKYEEGAFENCVGISGVTIPDTIKTIGEYSFSGCTGLKTVTIPDSVISISGYAFYNCSGISSIMLSQQLISIGNSAFSNCSGLKNLVIPNTVTTIGKDAFENCSGLKEITLSENLTKIGSGTFKECSGLATIVIPESVTTISGSGYMNGGAFCRCSNLEKILIPDSVATIDDYSFYDCDKLTIYGNDGMTSKEYAEANDINFKYISQWDESDIGDDITAPYVDSIQVPYSNISSYYDSNSTTFIVPSGKVLIINVNFNENILATEVPSLTIRFGSGSNIVLTEGTVSGSTVAYTYTIAKDDVGTMATVSLTGGNATDNAGNEAELSCPELKVQAWNNHYIYANGTAINVEDENNNNIDNNNGSNENTNVNNNNSNNTNNSNDNSNNTDTTKEDNTTANGILPKAGLSIYVSFAIVAFISGCVYAYFKYKKLRDI